MNECPLQVDKSKTLIVTVGLPRSGKTSYVKKTRLPIVNPDSIRLALHGMPFVALAEPFVWAIAKVMVRALFLAGHNKVVLDATNTTRKRRDEWKSSSWRREFAVFYASREVCRERAIATTEPGEHRDGLLAAIDRMSEEFEDVTADEQD